MVTSNFRPSHAGLPSFYYLQINLYSTIPDYPGLGFPVRLDPQDHDPVYNIGTCGGSCGADSDLLPVRELAMMSIMDRLTDKEEWHKKVFDEPIPDKQFWRLAIRDKSQWRDRLGKFLLRDGYMSDSMKPLTGIMSARTFDYGSACQLQSKAKYYEETRLVPIFDASASIAKADNLVCYDLHHSFRKAFDTLKIDQSSELDRHPNSNEIVQDLAHPSM
ncbi:hypothetical protein NHQ30_007754 [Ciborinia camelliae]|nr:hypothetical protein NHQ30_007754 [Ciborinia camelliae]